MAQAHWRSVAPGPLGRIHWETISAPPADICAIRVCATRDSMPEICAFSSSLDRSENLGRMKAT